mmetsp:Transcript_408/g.1113  ORF Transcript_408/g.1113 Transcript_408/m.1113 type:complete len:252 (-) Transcript_408:93-848(-)
MSGLPSSPSSQRPRRLLRTRGVAASALLVLVALVGTAAEPRLSEERMVFQLEHGDIEFAFLPEVAPVTAAHIFELVALGLYTSNHIFRVDKGFVAQTADVDRRLLPMNAQQKAVASKTVPLEVVPDVKHVEGVLSMGRYDDPNSGTSSFSILLGAAPHLDMAYTIFARITRGMDIVHKLETLPTRTEGIFVMPLERISITSTYWYRAHGPLHLHLAESDADCQSELQDLKARFSSQAAELQRVREKCLPGT